VRLDDVRGFVFDVDGSLVHRGADFDRDFLPRRPEIGLRWRSVEGAFPEGGFPPISVYKLGDAYFIIDGHHRVRACQELSRRAQAGQRMRAVIPSFDLR
jgi:hypothetical protein